LAVRIAPLSKKVASHHPLAERTARILISLVFLGVGLAIGYAYVKSIGAIIAARRWRPTTCEIQSSRVYATSGVDQAYGIAVRYRYEAEGHSFTGNRSRLANILTHNRSAIDAEVAPLAPGAKVECWYNPARLHESVIDRGLRDDNILMALFPVLVIGVGAGGLAVGVFGQRAKAPISRLAHSGMAKRISRRIPTQLKPKRTRGARVAELLALSLGWAVFALFWVRNSETGGLTNIFALVMLGVIGVSLVGKTVKHTLALSNPRVALAVDSPSVTLGDELRIDWTVDGKLDQVERLSIVLEGREEITYRQGKRTETETNRFAAIAVMTEAAPDIAPAGSARITIPGSTMHSFDGKANKVIWVLRVRGSVTNWPDIDDAFPLTLLPAR
jgi:hypothetical protein